MPVFSDNDQNERGEVLEDGGGNGDQRREEERQAKERNSGSWDPADYPHHYTPFDLHHNQYVLGEGDTFEINNINMSSDKDASSDTISGWYYESNS